MGLFCWLVLQFEDTVYSVLTLMLVFILMAFTLLLLNIEFLAYTYLIVYVGAVMLLFVFVVFMVGPIYTTRYRQDSFGFFYLCVAKFLILFSVAVWDFFFFVGYHKYQIGEGFLSKAVYTNDIFLFSDLLYTDHFFLLWTVAVILLIAMVAPIVFHFNQKS
jgi:NADH:ubiquinone oxidoreductase subunit 6 (subunit J)